jgi:hypothetical protein
VLFEFLEGVTKLGRFVRSTRRVGFGEKIEDYVLAAESGQCNGASVVGVGLKLRRSIAFF